MNDITDKVLLSSFRDPNGFLFKENGVLYRQVNRSYKKDYGKLFSTGLYEHLTKRTKLVSHIETTHPGVSEDSFLVIQPELIPFISYPHEWSFSQLKDAALLTLDLQVNALEKGMSLKDASAYNVQFLRGKAIFIDTLSFESYQEGSPWVAYKQFCQHFLAPLALMSHTDIRLNKLLVNFIDGIPLDLASKLLPVKSKLSLGLGLHIHLHAKQQLKSSDKILDKEKVSRSMPKRSLLALLDSLKSTITKLKWTPSGTEWHDYYISNNNYDANSLSDKEKLVENYIIQCSPKIVWDLGANDGRFSRVVSKHVNQVVSWDIDPACVENNFLSARKNKETKILPLLIDLTNPSPGIGWANEERETFLKRGPADAILALGLIHHLAISNNVPLERIARTFRALTKNLIIEFIPKEDSQVIKLLSSRNDIFSHYDIKNFEKVFLLYFEIVAKQEIPNTCRTLFYLKGKGSSL